MPYGCKPPKLAPPPKMESQTDAVNHPSHYTSGKIEVIEYIEDRLTPEQLEGYYVGNILKYLSRYRLKNGAEDLKKAQLDRLISIKEK